MSVFTCHPSQSYVWVLRLHLNGLGNITIHLSPQKLHSSHEYTSFQYYKIREKKGKTLTENWRDLWRKGTHEHMETYSKYFDGHKCLSQSEESNWTHGKDSITREFLEGATRRLQERRGWREILKETSDNFLLNFPPSLPLSEPPGATFQKLSSDAIFAMCSHIFLFRLRKTSVTIEILWMFLCVCVCLSSRYLFNFW